MKKYNLLNNISGWVIFAVALVVYLLTIEPTMSFWDCSEFITSAFKLEVGHPPGAPVFMIIGNFMSHFASDVTQVALWLNALSAIFSALTILFLFWTITHLVRRITVGGKATDMTLSQLITILGSGAVGALAYTFSDTFWFSAVEGEVYAFSSLMTALVFWLILKWEDAADEPHAGRWLILIAYLMGISIGIHLLNLLCIPAIVLVYYFRKTHTPTWKGIAGALLISFGILIAVLYGLVQGLVEVAGVFELFSVNTLHLPYNTGVFFYLIVILGVLGWGIWTTVGSSLAGAQHVKQLKQTKIAFITAIVLLGIPFLGSGIWLGILLIIVLCCYLFISKKINPVVLNSILIGLLVMTIGYSSYALIMIRSAANTPMDQNSPEDIFTLRDYLSREQYGATPLFYGQTFVGEPKRNAGGNIEYKDNGPVYSRVPKKDASEPDHYYESSRRTEVVYMDKLNTFFPRMFSDKGPHVQAYKQWSNFKGQKVRIPEMQQDGTMSSRVVEKPTFGENLRYFFSYQVNFMYWRYFMWNFAGRQNDIQGHGEVSNGNWITGISFLDTPRVGPQKDMPDFIAKNKGHNVYYLLPLLLGLLGIFVQIKSGQKGAQQFWVCFSLFFMTGLAIVLYLNQTPYQPRERDYAYAGSFYAYCIWIGIGVVGLIKGLERLKLSPTLSAAMATVVALLIPLQMVSQTWDDHDRSQRFVARDLGRNYLTTCEPNAIIYTNGDNDTFPLWYAQEVEGYRTDVRVCNLSYLQTDWYIDQMKRQAYTSKPLPIDWQKWEYVQGNHDVAYVVPLDTGIWTADIVLERIKSEDPRTKNIPGYGVQLDNIPTYRVAFPVDSGAVIAANVVSAKYTPFIQPYMLLNLGPVYNEQGKPVENAKHYLGKQELMVLDMLKNNADWKRPIYFSTTVGDENYVRLQKYFRQDGMAYRIVPVEMNKGMDPDIAYDNLMNNYVWGNMDKKDLYMDENCRRLARTFRITFAELAQTLAHEQDVKRTEAVVDRCLQVIPDHNVPFDFYYGGQELADALAQVGKTEKATKLYVQLADVVTRELNWYNRLNTNQYASVFNDVRKDIAAMQTILYYFQENAPEQMEKYRITYEESINHYQRLMNQGGNNL
ncbi:MAG: DUF2723 domain-containing protein [Candidatus Symbiothrix sp.]|jgi:hypothetical protein|nr:DUF2723 domain-containing protein [Candidatus Symbiothrix sp.]